MLAHSNTYSLIYSQTHILEWRDSRKRLNPSFRIKRNMIYVVPLCWVVVVVPLGHFWRRGSFVDNLQVVSTSFVFPSSELKSIYIYIYIYNTSHIIYVLKHAMQVYCLRVVYYFLFVYTVLVRRRRYPKRDADKRKATKFFKWPS